MWMFGIGCGGAIRSGVTAIKHLVKNDDLNNVSTKNEIEDLIFFGGEVFLSIFALSFNPLISIHFGR